MTGTFNFNGAMQFQGQIEIDDLGQACIEAIDSYERHYFIVFRTKLGIVSCLEFGPLYIFTATDSEIDGDFSVKYSKFDFKSSLINELINTFLKSRKPPRGERGSARIVEVRQITFEEAISYGVDIFSYIKDEDNY